LVLTDGFADAGTREVVRLRELKKALLALLFSGDVRVKLDEAAL